MNSNGKWLGACAGALVIGGVIGYVVNQPAPPAPAAPPPAGSVLHRSELAPPPPFFPPASTAPIDPPVASEEAVEQTRGSLTAALRIPNEMRRQHDLYELVGRMNPGEIAGAIEMARRLPPQDREVLLPLLL